jgi:hypothetical protein
MCKTRRARTYAKHGAENKDVVKQLKVEMKAMVEAMAKEREEEVRIRLGFCTTWVKPIDCWGLVELAMGVGWWVLLVMDRLSQVQLTRRSSS